MFDFSLQQLLLRFASILLVVGVHGYVQARVALQLGDAGPKYDKRLTLNPLAHVNALGTLALLFFSIGWIKPLALDMNELHRPRRDLTAIALMSLFVNLLIALILYLVQPLMFTVLQGSAAIAVATLLNTAVRLNLWFVASNLMPIPPFTASLLLSALAPSLHPFWQKYLRYISFFLAALIATGVPTRLLRPLPRLLSRWLLSQ